MFNKAIRETQILFISLAILYTCGCVYVLSRSETLCLYHNNIYFFFCFVYNENTQDFILKHIRQKVLLLKQFAPNNQYN